MKKASKFYAIIIVVGLLALCLYDFVFIGNVNAVPMNDNIVDSKYASSAVLMVWRNPSTGHIESKQLNDKVP